MNKEFKTLKCNNPLEKGLGFHFSACELINGCWIPEMFLIWNYKDGTYNEITPEWSCTRTTCYFVEGQGIGEKIDSPEFRVKFLSFLKGEKMAFFNNGDWMMFNPIANGIIGTINQAPHTLFSEGIHNPNHLIILAQKPIEIVSDIQKKLFKRENVKVGGKPHNLIYDIKMNQYFSTTGDN